MNNLTCYLFTFLLLQSCTPTASTDSTTLFQTLRPEITGIDFNNTLTVSNQMNFFEYGNYYLGGGVAVGDFDQDLQADLYFTGNMVANKMYLNQGGLKFQDITEKAGVAGDNRWMTGCAVVDINADGRDDVYISVAGKWTNRKNILYINKGLDEDGIPVFEDMADQYGLADEGFSIQTTFLDYDNDGDLDVFVANYPYTRFNYSVKQYKKLMDEVTMEQSDHLYRNNGDNTFTDVTQEAKVMSYGLALGVLANDFNNDGWTDLYVSNDFHTPDFFYLNQGDGTFQEISKESVQHTAFYGMGIDAADYNNDGLLDLMQLEMAPADNFRSKANMDSMDPNRFWTMVDSGFHYQYMYNALQTAVGVRDNGLPFYAETAKLSGLHKTDWSWACLFADFDNSGFKDLFITNGVRKDINNKDYFAWLREMETKNKQSRIKYDGLTLPQLIDKMPAQKLDNPIYKNVAGQRFVAANEDWGLHFKGFSNGAAYADLDNDGDLELIVNNVDSTAAIFKNLSMERKLNNYLAIDLIGPATNPDGLGAKILLVNNENTQYHEHTRVRGFQSAMEQKVHFGIGQSTMIDKITINWADGKQQILTDIRANQSISIDYAKAQNAAVTSQKTKPLFKEVSSETTSSFIHQENEFDDFEREVLLPHKMSAFGPALAAADVNGDGIDDLFIGGAKDQNACLMLSTNGTPNYSNCQSLSNENHEDVDALFFDADGDQDLDLYVVSGGNEKPEGDDYYKDRIYENDGKGKFTLLANSFAMDAASGSVVINADYDGDGDLDLFVGSRQIPGHYGLPATSYLLENVSTDSGIKFNTLNVADFSELGMVTDAIWDDFDKDGDQDLIVVGEWMPVTFIENEAGSFNIKAMPNFDTQTVGWWNTIEKGDFDQDGDNDYVLGNLGLNYKYKASQEASFDLYAGDFDKNNQHDIVLGYYQEGIQFPVRGKQCSAQQIPDIKEKFTSYDAFASAGLSQIYSPQSLGNSLHYQATEFAHVYIENLGSGTFSYQHLPLSTQISSVNAIETFDFNRDGHLDLLMGGNLMNAEVETPRNDAGYGWLLLGDGQGGFIHQNYTSTGLYVPYETRKIQVINLNQKPLLIFANNDRPLKIYAF
ncbi:MAG: VCBS repeat-containing protein [Saprospiraceae bacterium]